MIKAVPEFVAFAVGLFLAWLLEWRVEHLVWSLWLGSLLVGFATILCAVGGQLWAGSGTGFGEEGPDDQRSMGLFGLLFLLVFFSFHFCGFHAGHATFLSNFFPVAGLETREFMDAFMNPPKLLWIALSDLLPIYGWWLLPLVIAEGRGLWKLLNVGAREVQDVMKEKKIGGVMKRPYANVVKMHLLIFAFAGCRGLGVDGFPVYAVVSLFYFFPWRLVREGFLGKKGSLRG